VNQEGHGDCHFFAAVAAAAKQDWHLISNRISANGDETSFTVTLFDKDDKYHPGGVANGPNQWETFTYSSLDILTRGFDMGGVTGDYDGPSGTDTGKAEIWPLLLEWAYADLNGGWAGTPGSANPINAWSALTGQTSEYHNTAAMASGDIRNLIDNALAEPAPNTKQVILETKAVFPDGSTKYTTPGTGFKVYANHAYTVREFYIDPATNTAAGYWLINPWGAGTDTVILFTDLSTLIKAVRIVG
jgi:hypothetical protein